MSLADIATHATDLHGTPYPLIYLTPPPPEVHLE
jgi:hypothetical protein